jgi:hypothetical protein
MKVFCFIFSFYLLILSWQPCQDLVNIDSFHSQNTYAQTDFHNSQEQNESDDCSPLCICSCCQISFDSNNFGFPEPENIKVEILQKSINFYKNPYQKNYNPNIWQPPKSQA